MIYHINLIIYIIYMIISIYIKYIYVYICTVNLKLSTIPPKENKFVGDCWSLAAKLQVLRQAQCLKKMEKECHFLANMLFHTTCVLSSMFYLQCQQTGHKLIGFVTKRGHRFWRPGAENLQNDGSGLRTPHCGSGTCKKTTISWRSIGASFSNWWLVTPLNLPQLGVKILKNI